MSVPGVTPSLVYLRVCVCVRKQQIEAVVKQKEMTAKARRKFEQDRFEAKQAMRKRMIDRVRGWQLG